MKKVRYAPITWLSHHLAHSEKNERITWLIFVKLRVIRHRKRRKGVVINADLYKNGYSGYLERREFDGNDESAIGGDYGRFAGRRKIIEKVNVL